MRFVTSDTIIAPATPPGEGGVAVVRLSGPQAEELLRLCFRPSSPSATFQSHRLYHGKIVHPAQGCPIDEVLCVLMKGPRSFTREDVVEIHCHGGPLLVRRIIDLMVDYGARMAGPGEFTLRAFLNGRLDLTRAEAVIDLISARSEAAGEIALRQLEGELGKSIYRLRDSVAELLASVESHIDFPEEDIEVDALSSLRGAGEDICSSMDRLIDTFQTGRTLREGLSLLLLGRPNVGKSSLLNALLGEARAIVTEIPGTTRDTLEEQLVLGGYPLRLIDTAGIRESIDPVEREGVRRAKDKIRQSDLVLLVIDGSTATSEEDLLAFEACRDVSTLVVFNKRDAGAILPDERLLALPHVCVSALTGEGMDELRRSVLGFFTCGKGEKILETAVLTDRRHREILLRAKEGMSRFLEALDHSLSPEFLAFELRGALDALGEITGETTPDEILDAIFSRFCIGK